MELLIGVSVRAGKSRSKRTTRVAQNDVFMSRFDSRG